MRIYLSYIDTCRLYVFVVLLLWKIKSTNEKNFLSVEDEHQDSPNGKNFLSVDVAKQLGQQYKVTDRTIRNDGLFAAAIDTLADTLGNNLKNDIFLLTPN